MNEKEISGAMCWKLNIYVFVKIKNKIQKIRLNLTRANHVSVDL